MVDPVERWLRARPGVAGALEGPTGDLSELPPPVEEERLREHAVRIGYRRVGAPVGGGDRASRRTYLVVEQSRERAEALRSEGLPVIYGDATRPEVLDAAHLERARLVISSAPDAYQARAILSLVQRINPGVEVAIRTHSEEERAFLESHGARRACVSERELDVSLARRHFELPHDMEEVAARTLQVREHAPRGRAPRTVRE